MHDTNAQTPGHGKSGCGCGHVCGCCSAHVRSDCERDGHVPAGIGSTGPVHCRRCGLVLYRSQTLGVTTAEVR